MSISICQYCGMRYDQDYDVEHEDECEENPENEMTCGAMDRF